MSDPMITRIVLLLITCCVVTNSWADEFVWTGMGGNSLWNNPANWQNVTPGGGTDVDGIPDVNDSAIFSIDAATTNGWVRELCVESSTELTLPIGTLSIGDGEPRDITNSGIIAFAGTPSNNNDEVIRLFGDLSLVGGGEVILDESFDSKITNGELAHLINLDNTIRGAGSIEVAVVNESLIRAAGGILSFTESLDNTDGNIEIAPFGVLRGPFGLGAISGGTITGENGIIEGKFSNTTFEGEIRVGFTEAIFLNSITNNATVSFVGTPSNNNDEYLRIFGEVCLLGDGQIVLTETSDSRIYDPDFAAVLKNQGNTIRGAGRVEVDVVNESLVRAEGGTLSFTQSLDNTNGNIEIAPFGVLRGPFGLGDITGGTITGENGIIEGKFSNTTFEGEVRVGFTEARFSNVIINNGSVSFAGTPSNNNDEFLTIVDEVVLLGDGDIVLTEPFDSRMLDGGSGLLRNQGNTIRGTGIVEVPVINGGRLLADSPVGNLRFTENVALPPLGSTLAIQLDGFQFSDSGFYQFDSGLTLNGVLQIIVGDSFDAEIGQSYDILSTPTLNGVFSEIDGAMTQSLVNGYEFDVSYSDTVTVTVSDKYLLGDVDLDGVLSLLDVSPFVDLITNGQYQREADFNGDLLVNLLDVEPFVTLLTGG